MNVKLALVAAASVVATTLPAQTPFQVGSFTNVTVSGLLAVGIKNSEVTNTARPGMKSEWRIDDNTSRLIISSSSKIADGWNAIFRLESRFQADVRPIDPLVPGSTIYTGNATGWADGDTYGGISSPYGTVIFGKSTLYYTDTISMDYLGIPGAGEAYRIWDANGLASFNILDQVISVTKAGASVSNFTLGNTRSRNVLRYLSPKWSGFSFNAAYTKNPDGDEVKYVAPGTAGYSKAYNEGGTYYLGATYAKGAFVGSFSYLDKTVQGGVYTPAAYYGPLDLKAYRIGAAYTLPMKLKFGVVFDNSCYSNGNSSGTAGADAKRSAFEIPVSYTMGDHGFYVTYSKAGDIDSSRPDSGASQLNVCYDYALTKRAFIGIAYAAIKNDKNGHYTPFLSGYTFGGSLNSVNGENWHQIGINFNYWF